MLGGHETEDEVGLADSRRDHAHENFVGLDISGDRDVFELPVDVAVFRFVR